MRLASPRITPLEEKDWSPDAQAAVGQYNLVSMALNSLGVQLDAGLAGYARWRR